MIKITEFWHKDSAGAIRPETLIGKKFVHLKTSNIYVVIGVLLNASTDQWAIQYDRLDERQRGKFAFTRDMTEFMDGRFLAVE